MNELLRAAIASRVGNMGQRTNGNILPRGGMQMRAPSVPLQNWGGGIRPPSQGINIQDPRSLMGIFSRGKNVYGGGLPMAPGAGRPSQGAISRRLGQ